MNREQFDSTVGAVAIGRNEGTRLRRCLRSLRRELDNVVYVDSGSSDDSIAIAHEAGAVVVELQTDRPFSAARARNAGARRLLELTPHIRFIQFVDADCELASGWLTAATQALQRNDALALVCGRRRERTPHASIYNRLCEMEWNTRIGEARTCGGDALLRVEAFRQARGYDERLAAGEEPELCLRLRQMGWRIRRLDIDMTYHDAAMQRFSQWWRRSVRAGHACAAGLILHGFGPARYRQREAASIAAWTLLLPLLCLTLAWMLSPWWMLLLAAYPLMAVRIARRERARAPSTAQACLYAGFCLLGKWAEAVGLLQYTWQRWRNRPTVLVEYKQPAT